jgi:hypothetical protein
MAIKKSFVLEGRSWGCQAQKDCDTGRFFYPMRITKVYRNSVADGAGLRVGDVIEGWTIARESGFTNVRAETCFSSLQQFVDEATQQRMEAGGPCHVGAGKDNADARREERIQKQQAKAREDIIRYCAALHLPHVASEEALHLFAVAANTSNTCLKSGSVIDNYCSTVLVSIHCGR